MEQIKYLFNRYQKPLLRLANLDMGRKFLGIKHEIDQKDWIVKLTPNSYHIKTSKNKYKGVFRCYPLFAKKLAGVFSKIEITRNENLYKGLDKYQGLLHYTGLFEQSRVFPQIFLASGDPIYAGAGDGQCVVSDATWNTAHDHTGEASDYTSDPQKVRVLLFNGTYYIERCFFPIDTSAITSANTVNSAIFSVYVETSRDEDNDGKDYIGLVETFQASNTALQNDDYIDCGSDNGTAGRANQSSIQQGATAIDIGNISTSAYNNFTLNATGLPWVSQTSFTKLGLREGHDIEDEAIAAGADVSNYVDITMSENAGTTQDPKITVVYTTLDNMQGFFNV